MNWTDERVELLRKLWHDGLSCSQIAAELGGISRCAVIGKVHRLGLPGRERRTIENGRAGKRSRTPEQKLRRNFLERQKRGWAIPPELTSDAPTQPVEAPMDIPAEQQRTLHHLTNSTCKFPLWGPDKDTGMFCGGKTIEGLSYCGGHARLCYQPAGRRERKSAARKSAFQLRVRAA